ncbi:MAG: hypothetical protein ACLP01_30930 [Solirubrobacteraceae bacterium]
MGNRRLLSALAVSAIAIAIGSLVCASAAVAASAKKHAKAAITGRLSASGYTVIALGTNGKMTSSKARSFSLAIPAPQYTLQLINAQGRYAGPVVVVADGGGKVIVGLTGAVNLGTVDVIASKGYAKPAKPPRNSSLVRSRWAWAKQGVPIGNGRNFGLVKSPTKGTGPSGPGGDSDRSGIPNAFDIASGGNGVLNALAPRAQTNAAVQALIADTGDQESSSPGGGSFSGPGSPGSPGSSGSPGGGSNWMSQLFLPMDETVNEDASGVSQTQIDSTLQSNLNVKLLNIPSADLIELNCNGLSFCSPGGSGQASEEGIQSTTPGQTFNPLVPFPEATLDPATGFGEIVGPNVPTGFLGTLTGSGSQEFSLMPNATSSQIGSGDVITELITSGGVTTQTPTTLEFVFNTVPAISSYSDTAGDAGSITYPDTSNLGTSSNPIKVAAGANGDVTVTFTLFRPQRAGIPGAGEPAYMDVGDLWYSFDSVSAPAAGQTTVGAGSSPQCPLSSYMSAQPPLSIVGGGPGTGIQAGSPQGTGMLVDSAGDQPASPSNTITFTIDITACMTAKGQTFPLNQPIGFDISANSQSSSDHSNQTFWLQRTS